MRLKVERGGRGTPDPAHRGNRGHRGTGRDVVYCQTQGEKKTKRKTHTTYTHPRADACF